MHRTRNCLFIPLLSATLLAGCAAQATDRAPVPQALIQAAESATQMRMVYSDWQARAHGHTVENIRLDSRDADAPDFMRAQVRLDYNGPMENVLSRVANDIGYRLNEYAKPSSGLSWTPWMRLSGNKTLLDHLREMNSQVPWHIVLDHENRRLVIDYSDDGSMAAQVRNAREGLRLNSGRGQLNLPSSPEALTASSQAAVAQTLSNGPTLPRTTTTTQPSPVSPNEVWFAAIEGYDSNENARSMVIWLAQLGLDAHVFELGEQRYDVRVIAKTSRDAIRVRDLMDQHGVPSQLGYEETNGNEELKRRAEQAMRDGWPIEALAMEEEQFASSSTVSQAAITSPEPQRERARVTSSFAGSQADLKELARNRILSPEESAGVGKQWAIQLSYSNSLPGLGNAIHSVEQMGYTAGLVPASGDSYMLRATSFETRQSASTALAKLRGGGFGDAYLVSPKGE